MPSMAVYQATRLVPNKYTIIAEANKNGPKGSCVERLAFPVANNGNETNVPISAAMKIYKILRTGLASIAPIRNPSFTSPPPIHLPPEI